MTELLYAASAPVFKLAGQPNGDLGRDLLRLEVEESTAGLKTMRAIVAATSPASEVDGESIYLDGSVLDFGTELEVSLGPGGNERIVFTGVVSAIEALWEEAGLPMVRVFAEDTLMRLRMTRRVRTYEQVGDEDIARAIASEHGLQANVAAPGPTYDVVHQWNKSDLAFLRERARAVEAEIWFDGKLNFATRPNRSGTSVTLVRGNQLIGFEARADLAHQRSKVTVSGYDARDRARIEEETESEAIQAEVTGGTTGVSVLSRALGERVSHRVRETPLVAAEARAWARAEMLRRSRRFVTVLGTTSGTPELVVGSRISLERVGRAFNGGGYYATRVAHSYDVRKGHRTRFEAERPTVNGA